MVRVGVAHDDPSFARALAGALEAAGYEVQPPVNPIALPDPPRASDELEVMVSQSTGKYPGIRIRITGLPPVGYAGSLGQFIAEPVSIAVVLEGVRNSRSD
jgi:hypothetical protein